MAKKAPRSEQWMCLIGGIAFMALGCLLIWRGFSTPLGEAAIRVPMREGWSATEAKVIGSACCALGIYIAAFLGRHPG